MIMVNSKIAILTMLLKNIIFRICFCLLPYILLALSMTFYPNPMGVDQPLVAIIIIREEISPIQVYQWVHRQLLSKDILSLQKKL
jgi:hypothetical protein